MSPTSRPDPKNSSLESAAFRAGENRNTTASQSQCPTLDGWVPCHGGVEQRPILSPLDASRRAHATTFGCRRIVTDELVEQVGWFINDRVG
jgi:hypothetical protein